MKKIIALGLVLTLCLTGCADAKKEQLAEETLSSISQSEQVSESIEPTAEKTTTTEEATIITETEEQLEKGPTQTELFLKLLEDDDGSAEAQIEAQSYLRPFELALYDLMCYANNVCEGIDYFSYYENDRYKYLFAWQLAECEPTIVKEHITGDDPDATAGSIAMTKEEFRRYYMSLFGEEADIWRFSLGCTPYGYCEEKDDYVCMNYNGGMQDLTPVLKNPKLQYESETDDYLLTMDVLAQQEYQYINGSYHYALIGDYINFNDPTIIEYPEEYVFAKAIFRMNKTENGYHFKSIEFQDINYDTYTLAEGENPYLGKPLTELMDLMQLDTRPSDDLLVPLQAALYYDYQPAICWLALSDDWEVEIEKNYDYLSSPEGKAVFVWYQIASGEKNHPMIFRIEGAENATSTTFVEVEDFAKCYRELLGEEVDFEQIGELKCISAPHDGTIGGFGLPPACETTVPELKNPILSYDDASGEYVLSMDLVNDDDYFQYDITEYPQESVIGTIIFRMVKTESGYQFKSIIITE